MRQRSTWKNERQAAVSRTADIYTMNQEHPQPSPTQYENGDPDSWAETPTSNGNVQKTYDGDSEARNELGFGEFAPDTFDHKDSKEWGGSGKYDNQRTINASTRKAQFAQRVASAILRTDNKSLIEKQALDLMTLPDQVLVATVRRLDQVSPNALSKVSKLHRAHACCKIAAAMLPEKTSFSTVGKWESLVQRVATTLTTLDDVTLKSIIKCAAEAAEDVKEEEETVSSETEGEEEETVSSETEGEEEETVSCNETSCLAPEDQALFDSMVVEVVPAVPAVPAVAPDTALTSLFGGGEAVVGSSEEEEEGDDDDWFSDDESESTAASDELDSVFENDETAAQREIRAAHFEQGQREHNTFEKRTASAGAKKLGNVKRTASAVDELEAIWC